MDNNLERLWGEDSLRVFISHIADDKKLAHGLKSGLQEYGIAAFVAHDDIEPMSQWEGEIRRALLRMDLLVALLTPNFSDSNWTDQEVGAAIGRCVPVVPVSFGKDPYGFMGKYQAISGANRTARQIAAAIFEFALGHEDLGELAVDTCIAELRHSGTFDRAKRLARRMEGITVLSQKQEGDLVDAYNTNDQAYEAWGVGRSIASLLKQATGNAYEITEGRKLRKRMENAPDN